MQGTNSLRALILGCLVAAPLAHAAVVETPMDFVAAKAAADADEASQEDTARTVALEQQSAFLDAGVSACADARSTARLEAFVIVVELDATGHVVRTWRRGDSPLALCIERQARGKRMFVPPRAPFHASLEVSFTP
ncbi:MAG: hypothetical protein L0H23_05095 [Luteimonas sp.]|nr:hypothetical protein [Luteimonas sp.]